MSQILLLHILFCLIFTAVIYASDLPKFPKGKVSGLKMPSVTDLLETPSIYVIDDYVKTVIIPSYDYFSLNSQYFDDEPSIKDCLYFFYLLLPLAYMAKILRNAYPFAKFIFYMALCVLCCIIAMCAIYLIYKRYFKLESFDLSEQDLRNQFLRHKETFPISDRRSFYNYTIDRYLSYYSRIDKRATRRRTFSKILNSVLIVIYLLFFYTPYYS